MSSEKRYFDMKKDFSPEERLLRLIKGAKKKEAPRPEEPPPPRIQPQVEPPPSVSGFARRPDVPREVKPARQERAISIPLPFKLKDVNMRALNSVFIALLTCIILYFAFDIVYTAYIKESDMEVITEDASRPANVEEAKALEIKPYSYYSSSIEGRNIFMPPQVEADAVATGPSIEEVMADFSLIGIIAGDRPQAIIEDKKSAKSHFLYEGNSVGLVKVLEIKEGSVIMEYQGQKFELVL